MKKNKLLFTENEWTYSLIDKTWRVISDIAVNKYGLSFYEPQIEIVDFETMIVNQSVTVGLPVTYTHWSHGAKYIKEREGYVMGASGLAYELIINSDPAIAYLMENNTMALQTLVLAHASVGHSAFFKNNYMFKEGISAKYIIPFMEYAASYIDKCETRHGINNVTEVLDMAHALQDNSMIYKKATSIKKDMERRIQYNKYIEDNYNELFKDFEKVDKVKDLEGEDDEVVFEFPEYNLLYFIEKSSLIAPRWEREILRIIRMMSQYFYPQTMTKLMNEGYATFWHYTLTYDLYNDGYISEGTMMEILDSHCGVCHVPENVAVYNINPYKFGSEIFFDIKRICTDPTEEDKYWFPDLAGSKDWVKAVEYAMRNFNDESFILQYLSPTLVRKLGLMRIKFRGLDPYSSSRMYYEVAEIQSDEDFKNIRKAIASTYNFNYRRPSISIVEWNPVDKILKLNYHSIYGHAVHQDEGIEVVKYIEKLMGCSVDLELIEPEEVKNGTDSDN